MTSNSKKPNYLVTVPHRNSAMCVFEGKIGQNNTHKAYRAIESFLPNGNGTVLIYSEDQYKPLYQIDLTKTMILIDRAGEEYEYFIVGKEILNLQKDKVLINSGRREIKVVMPWPLYSLPFYTEFHLVVRGVIL